MVKKAKEAKPDRCGLEKGVDLDNGGRTEILGHGRGLDHGSSRGSVIHRVAGSMEKAHRKEENR